MNNTETPKKTAKFVIIDSANSVANNTEIANLALENKLDDSDSVDESYITPKSKLPVKELSKKKIIHQEMLDKQTLNSFRLLRMSVQNKLQEFNSCIAVSAVNSGGGASFVASNLAAAFAMSPQNNVLLIDCNLYSPSLGNVFQVDTEAGLYDYLAGSETSIGKIIYKSSIPRLSLVPVGYSGNVEQGEYFTGSRIVSLISEVRSRYKDRIIILDVPPILESADTKILSDLCDGVLLVIPFSRVTTLRVNQSLKEFGDGNILGCIINN